MIPFKNCLQTEKEKGKEKQKRNYSLMRESSWEHKALSAIRFNSVCLMQTFQWGKLMKTEAHHHSKTDRTRKGPVLFLIVSQTYFAQGKFAGSSVAQRWSF